MVSSEKKIKLTNYELNRIKDAALTNIKDLALAPTMDADAFMSYCWTKAVVDFMIKKGYTDIELTK